MVRLDSPIPLSLVPGPVCQTANWETKPPQQHSWPSQREGLRLTCSLRMRCTCARHSMKLVRDSVHTGSSLPHLAIVRAHAARAWQCQHYGASHSGSRIWCAAPRTRLGRAVQLGSFEWHPIVKPTEKIWTTPWMSMAPSDKFWCWRPWALSQQSWLGLHSKTLDVHQRQLIDHWSLWYPLLQTHLCASPWSPGLTATNLWPNHVAPAFFDCLHSWLLRATSLRPLWRPARPEDPASKS